MHIISVCYFSGQSQDFIYDEADADTAKEHFVTLQTAIAQYQKFKNDNSEAVSLISSSGRSVFRIEHLVSVAIMETKETEDIQTEYAEFQGRLMAARDAARASPLSRPMRSTPEMK